MLNFELQMAKRECGIVKAEGGKHADPTIKADTVPVAVPIGSRRAQPHATAARLSLDLGLARWFRFQTRDLGRVVDDQQY